MANISDYKQVPLSTILGDLTPYKYNPSKIVDVTLNRLSDMLDDKVDIVDPSNPFIYLLETSCLNTVFAIQEYALLTRKLYPRMANNEEDLYLHMSDFDYIGRFSEPARAQVTFNILYGSFIKNAITDTTTGDLFFKLPRHYKITVGKQVFTLLYPVIIRQTPSGIVDIRFDHSTLSDLQNLSTDYIEYFMINQFNNEKYIVFTLSMLELDIETLEIPVEKSKLFKNSLNYDQNRKFYYLQAFYYDNGQWNKILVTHTNQVYDINTPTMIVKVKQDGNTVDYYIPPVYVSNNRIGSKIKILVYTTNGYIDVNFNDYQLEDFAFEYNPVFKELDLDNYTAPLELISKVVAIRDRVVGGKNNMSFDTLKDKVITNSAGDRQLPVTDKQLSSLAQHSNFTLIKSVDTLTNRLYDLQVTTPKALTRYPITKLNFDILEYSNTLADMVFNGSVFRITDKKYIIPKNTVFKMVNGKLELLSGAEKTNLEGLEGIALVNEINSQNYYSTFFHYILDLNDAVADLRAYSLDSPKLVNINFKYYNTSTQIGANTSSFVITKKDNGYLLEVSTKVTNYIDEVNFTNINPYIVYQATGGSNFYIAGSLLTVVDGAPIYHFYLNSGFDIDKAGNISITNLKDINGVDANVYTQLDVTLDLIYLSDAQVGGYIPTVESSIVTNSYLANNYFLITHEQINLQLGVELTHLKRNTHNSTTVLKYQTHDQDVNLTYTENEYDNADTIIHYKGDIVLDNAGAPAKKHRKGDIVHDVSGNPIAVSELDIARYFNFLMIDYRAVRANNALIVDYLKYLRDYMVEVITVNTKSIHDELLENTQAYVTVPKNLDRVQARQDSALVSYVEAQQSFVINVQVTSAVYSDLNVKENINYIIISTIEDYLTSNRKISRSELISILFKNLKEFVSNISFAKFTTADAEYIELLDEKAGLTFNKVLFIDADGTYNLKEDITINYIKVD